MDTYRLKLTDHEMRHLSAIRDKYTLNPFQSKNKVFRNKNLEFQKKKKNLFIS